jgi:hypothetical protein
MRVQTREAVAFVASMLLIPVVARAEPVAAVISTTFATDSKQIRQFAFDGVGDTFFSGSSRLRVKIIRWRSASSRSRPTLR